VICFFEMAWSKYLTVKSLGLEHNRIYYKTTEKNAKGGESDPEMCPACMYPNVA